MHVNLSVTFRVAMSGRGQFAEGAVAQHSNTPLLHYSSFFIPQPAQPQGSTSSQSLCDLAARDTSGCHLHLPQLGDESVSELCLLRLPPGRKERWGERHLPKRIHYDKFDKGGYFPVWEQPQPFAEELRAGNNGSAMAECR